MAYGDRYQDDEPPDGKKRRNARARYCLTVEGNGALAVYRQRVEQAQQGSGGRDALELAQQGWAAERRVEAVDALLLSELADRQQTILELTRSLVDCGIKRPTVEEAIDRLSEADLIEPERTSS